LRIPVFQAEGCGCKSRRGGLSLKCVRGVRATRRSASPQFRVRIPARAPRSCGVKAAQRTFNPHGAGASPAGSTILRLFELRLGRPNSPMVIEGGYGRSLPASDRPEPWFNTTYPSSQGTGAQNRGSRVQIPPSCPLSGVVVIKAARRARNAEETERYRPAPPFAREVLRDA
jgi:hypothetical protein